MDKRKAILSIGLSGILLGFSCSLLTNFNLSREYKVGDYVKEEGAYLVAKVDDKEAGSKAYPALVPTDSRYPSQKTHSLGSDLIGDIESVWDNYTGNGIKVAIIDDGFDYTNPEYIRSDNTSAILPESRYYYYSGGYVYNKKYSEDPTCIAENWNTTTNKWNIHGTNTSITLGGPINNVGCVGVAPDVDILALKTDFTLDSIYHCILYAIEQDVDVINMSIESYASSFTDPFGKYIAGASRNATILDPACNAAYDAGIIMVGAAGNHAVSNKSYPACSPHVIGVGATGDYTNKGNSDVLAPFTNYVGDSQTGEVNVDIVAPGYVLAPGPGGTQTSPTHTYWETYGTSFSCPIIAGAACLWKEKNPSGTPDQFLAALQSSADKIGYYEDLYIPASDSGASSNQGPSNITNGTLNVAKLMSDDKELSYISVSDAKTTFTVGDTFSFGGTVTAHYTNGSSADVTNSATFTGYNMANSGNQTVTVSYTEGGINKTTTYAITVNKPAGSQSYSHTFTYSEKGTTWTLSNASDQSSYWLCPSGSTTSIAFFDEIFTGKAINSDVKITINSATYDNGTNPSTNTYKIYNSEACSTQVSATQSGTLPSSSTYTNVIYTVSKTNASSFSDDLAILITKPGKQIRLKSIKVEFEYVEAAPKVIASLTASYSGGDVYAGNALDTSKVSVTAHYTDSSVYADKVLDSSEYSLSGFSSEYSGNKTVTVTYTGATAVETSPMTTTFVVTVKNDSVTKVTVSNNKTYHPGETITKSDITVTLSWESGKADTITTEFEFTDYQFTYADTNPGSTAKSKQFSIIYDENEYNFSVNVTRVAYVTPVASVTTLTGEQGQDAGITGTSAKGAADYTNLNINGVTCAATNIYVYKASSVYYFSFGQGTGEIHNTTALAKPISSLSIDLRSGARSDGKLYVSTTGNVNDYVLLANADFTNNNYYYFKVAYESSSSSYSNFNNINISFSDIDNVINVCNYIMYEDTNGQCETKLDIALGKLNNMITSDKETFMTSNDYVIKQARERMNKWAEHEHKSISLVDGNIVMNTSSITLNNQVSMNNEVIMIIISISSMLVLSLLAVSIIHKKKEQ